MAVSFALFQKLAHAKLLANWFHLPQTSWNRVVPFPCFKKLPNSTVEVADNVSHMPEDMQKTPDSSFRTQHIVPPVQPSLVEHT